MRLTAVLYRYRDISNDRNARGYLVLGSYAQGLLYITQDTSAWEQQG